MLAGYFDILLHFTFRKTLAVDLTFAMSYVVCCIIDNVLAVLTVVPFINLEKF